MVFIGMIRGKMIVNFIGVLVFFYFFKVNRFFVVRYKRKVGL